MPALSYRQLKIKLNNMSITTGLYRKFANQILEQLAHENNIPLDAVVLIMSRGLTVVSTHPQQTGVSRQALQPVC